MGTIFTICLVVGLFFLIRARRNWEKELKERKTDRTYWDNFFSNIIIAALLVAARLCLVMDAR